jgi:hypothetical protein
MINRWNPIISSVLRSNHDISFIPSTSKTLASVYYMTNYATKDDIKLHQVVMMGAVLRLSMEHAETEGRASQTQQVESARHAQPIPPAQTVDWSKFALRLYNRFAREREISGVAIANHILQQPAFYLPLGEQRRVNISLFWVRFEVTRIACLSRDSELPDGVEETSQNQYSTFTASDTQPTTIYDKYRHRGPELADVCFYEYCCQVQTVKLEHMRSSDVRFDKEYANYNTLCQRVATQRRDLITPSIYGKISELENQQDAVTGDYQNEGPILNDHCQVLLGLYIPWNQLLGLFDDFSGDFDNPSDACSFIWDRIKDLQPPYIQRLAFNISLLRKSKEDAEADRIAREQELLDFDDISFENTTEEGDEIDMIPYQPRVMSKSELFHSYAMIMGKWQKDTIMGQQQPFCLQVDSLTPLRSSVLRTDDSLSYFQESILDEWKVQLKHLRKTLSNRQDPEFADTLTLRDQDEEAVYEPGVVSARDYGVDIEQIKAGLGPNPSIDDILSYLTTTFTPNEKQALIIRNVLGAVLGLDTSRGVSVTDSSQQFLLYVGGCGGTGKTQVINAILYGMELLSLRGRTCVTASTGAAAAHIKGQTVHSAVGITGQRKTLSLSPIKVTTLQNLLRGIVLFIADEISMVSTKLLGQVNQNCAKIFELPTSGSAVFGGVPVVLVFGDFFQFPPVGGEPLWTSRPLQSFPDLEREGWDTWRKFNQVIILTECLRQKEDQPYQELLQRARAVTMTQEDVDLLNTHTIAQRMARGERLPELSISTKNKLRHDLNRMHIIDFARTRNQKIYIFAATHKPIASRSQSKSNQRLFGNPTDISFSKMLEIDDRNHLKGSGFLLYTKGMPVMCLDNVSTPSGVVNGMCGIALHAVPNPAGK